MTVDSGLVKMDLSARRRRSPLETVTAVTETYSSFQGWMASLTLLSFRRSKIGFLCETVEVREDKDPHETNKVTENTRAH